MKLFYSILFASLVTLTFYVAVKIKKKRDQNTIAELKKKVWKVFSVYIRSKDKDFQDNISCFTCDRRDHWRSFDTGHYIPKSSCGAALYFHEKNNHPQCTGCNRFRHGNLTIYAIRLRQKYGDGVLEELDALRGKQWNGKELERLLAHYTVLTKTVK